MPGMRSPRHSTLVELSRHHLEIRLASSPGSQKGEGEGKREPGIQRSRMR